MIDERDQRTNPPLWRRALRALEAQLSAVHPRLHAYDIATSLLPRRSSALRSRLLRRLGFEVGEGTEIAERLKIIAPHGGSARLEIGRDCSIGADSLIELSQDVRIGDRVTLEPGVMIFTSTRELDSPSPRAGKVLASPVSIGDGAWLRARSIVQPGVQIGPGAVVEAGALVNKDVEAHTRVGGAPIVKLESLQSGDEK